MWAIDVDARTATPLLLDADSLVATLVIAEQARWPGELAAIRLRDGRAEWGQLLADEGTALFKRRTALPTSAGGRTLDLTGRLYLDARARGWCRQRDGSSERFPNPWTCLSDLGSTISTVVDAARRCVVVALRGEHQCPSFRPSATWR